MSPGGMREIEIDGHGAAGRFIRYQSSSVAFTIRSSTLLGSLKKVASPRVSLSS